MNVPITWYGRCCFFVELNGKRILFDPYDMYCNVDIGRIDADILISSSTWHDHGHIGASPHAWVCTYPGAYEHDGLTITGIEAKESRGTPTVVFNVRYGSISITNFADLGAEHDEEFDRSLTPEARTILQSTTIAFMRASIIGDQVADHNTHNETILKYCAPAIIFPEHYFPPSFIEEQVPESEKQKFLQPNVIVDEMVHVLGYPVEEVDDCSVTIDAEATRGAKKLYKLRRLHPQVRYVTPTSR